MSTPPATHCKQGHHLATVGTYKDGRCKPCKDAREKAYRQRRRTGQTLPPKTHCKNGHERTPDNLTNSKHCRTCQREQDRARYWAAKGTPPPEHHPKPAHPERHQNNVAGLTHYIQRRRQRLARQKRMELAA